jgi:hypothetical protein
MLAGSRGAFVNTPCQWLKLQRKHPAESPPVLLREYVLILSPIGKAAKGRSRKDSTVVPRESKVPGVGNGGEK